MHLYSINLIKYERKYPAMNKICRFLAAGILLLLLLSGCAGPNSPSALESSSSGSSSSEPGSSIESSSEPEPSSQEESSSQTASSTPEAALPQTFTVQVVNEEGEPEPNLDVYIWYSAPTPKQPDLYDLFTAGLTDQQGLTRQFSDVPATNLILEVYNHSINSGNDEESAEEYPFTPEEIQAQNGKVTLVWHKQSYREASEANAIRMAIRFRMPALILSAPKIPAWTTPANRSKNRKMTSPSRWVATLTQMGTTSTPSPPIPRSTSGTASNTVAPQQPRTVGLPKGS